VNQITSRGNEKKAVFKKPPYGIKFLNTPRHAKNGIIGFVMPAA
jgi:hypothetical protein